MPRAYAALTVLILLAIACLMMMAALLPAHAHSWYAKRRDPIFNRTSCCGGTDCRELPASSITVTPEGLRVRLTLEQAIFINPRRTEPFDELIDYDRIQVSEDANAHICLMPSSFDDRHGYYCIFLPPNT